MHLIKSAKALNRYLLVQRSKDPNVTIGFVPTMGALHQGHASLIESCVSENNISVCSIFVNPTQFGEKADLDNYPKPIEKDIEMLVALGCDILFLPRYEDIYPADYQHKTFDIGGLDFKIEGASRPGHFQGVCNVIDRFFSIVSPDAAYFGQKDYQQTVVVKRLVEVTGSNVEIRIVPIKRESHGLAMSSRNIRLSEKGRMNAAFIFKALNQLKEDIQTMSLSEALEKAKQFISAQKGAKIDYLLAVNSYSLEEVSDLESAEGVAVVTVVEYEGVRLLDNIILK